MEKNSLAPGFRFHPTDVELLRYYLRRKLLGKKLSFEAIGEVDIYKYAPWDLPDKSLLRAGDLKWYFFCPMEKKYGKGNRLNRATAYGYWKTTGNDRPVRHNDKVVGSIKTLVFHTGKAPRGERTDWVIHEYKLEDEDIVDKGDAYVLCVVFRKEGPGHRNGAQYGAPFREEDWTDDEEEVDKHISSTDLSTPAFDCATSPSVSDFFNYADAEVGFLEVSSTNLPTPPALDWATSPCVPDLSDWPTPALDWAISPSVPDLFSNADAEVGFLEVTDVVDDELLSMLAIYGGDYTSNNVINLFD